MADINTAAGRRRKQRRRSPLASWVMCVMALPTAALAVIGFLAPALRVFGLK